MLGGVTTAVMESATKFIQNTIQKNCVVIFAKPCCPYCRTASEVFDRLKVDYLTVDINTCPDAEYMQDAFHKMTGCRTVPRVFINGKCVGGGTETKELYQKKKLQQLIEKCSHNHQKDGVTSDQ